MMKPSRRGWLQALGLRRRGAGAAKRVRSGRAPAGRRILFESGYLDSFALPDLVTELEKQFGIRIPDSDLNPRKFESLSRIEATLRGGNSNACCG